MEVLEVEVLASFYVRSREILANDFSHLVKLFINFFFLKLNDFISPGALYPYENYFRQIFWEPINKREKTGVKRGDLIDMLVELKHEPNNDIFTFDGDYLLVLARNLFIAGLDKNATTMCFTLDIQIKVREELRQKFGDEKLTNDRVSEIRYLQQAINETLRIHPIAPILDRMANEDYKIPGTDIVVEKGTAVYASLPGLHYDPQHHPDPMTYDPDRFNKETKHLIKPGTFMPFGEGPRICIVKRTGILMTMVGLITILREYEVSWDSKYKSETNIRNIFGNPTDGIHLNFKRSPNINS